MEAGERPGHEPQADRDDGERRGDGARRDEEEHVAREELSHPLRVEEVDGVAQLPALVEVVPARVEDALEDLPLAPEVAQEAERLLLDDTAAPEGRGRQGEEDGEPGEASPQVPTPRP